MAEEVTMGMQAQEQEQETTQGRPDGAEGPMAPVPGVSQAQARPAADDAEEARQAAATEAFARGHEELTDENERDALDFLLAPKPARLYDVKVTYETEDGPRPMVFVIRGHDGRKIDDIETSNRSEVTGRFDQITADCQLVAAATAFIEGRPGHRVELTSSEFLTVRVPNPDRPGETMEHTFASPADAIEARFRTQLGLVSGIAQQIRRVSGYDPQRVGMANRRLVNAAGNS
jgi:hypothetical protein